MSRLIFAAARGAKIQRLYYKYKDEPQNWESTNALDLRDSYLYDYRIHPDYESFQYGPVSTALREFAETGKDPHTLSSLMAIKALQYECAPYCPFGIKPDTNHLQWFVLILAEKLADEGS
jgi:hypothetical protein